MIAKYKVKKNHNLYCLRNDSGTYQFLVRKFVLVDEEKQYSKIGWTIKRIFLKGVIIEKEFLFTPETLAGMAGLLYQ